jgi:hypothetical protein
MFVLIVRAIWVSVEISSVTATGLKDEAIVVPTWLDSEIHRRFAKQALGQRGCSLPATGV